jgi:FtsZ-interacting cell division protein ZipA
MTAQWLPILMGVIALIAIIIKVWPRSGAEKQLFFVSQEKQNRNGGLISVSGVTVEQLRVIADALEKQKAAQ